MTNNPKTDRPLGWALIGCGGIGRHHAAWAVETPAVEVRGFCDSNGEAANRFHQQYGGGYATTDPARVFADPAVDIVTIATPHGTHTDLALAACAAKKHLYLEKPMAMTTADCLRIYAAMQTAGIKLMINFSIRFSGATREIKRRLRPPKVSHGQCMVSRDDLTRWQWHPEIGGGPLYDVGIHLVDALCWQHDSLPIEVYATGGQVTHSDELASSQLIDTVAATIRFANGSIATLLMSDAGFNTFTSKWLFQFFDGEQTAILYEHFSKVTFGWNDPTTGKPASETIAPPPIARLPLLVEAIRNDTETYVPALTGILSTLIVEKIIASIHSGQPQKVDLHAVLQTA